MKIIINIIVITCASKVGTKENDIKYRINERYPNIMKNIPITFIFVAVSSFTNHPILIRFSILISFRARFKGLYTNI